MLLVIFFISQLSTALLQGSVMAKENLKGCIQLKSYSFCDSNLLNVTKIESSCSSGEVIITILATPTEMVTSGSIAVNAKDSTFGIKLLSQTYPLCSYAPCPLQKGINTTSVLQLVDPLSSGVTGGIDAKIKITDMNGKEISCVNTHFE